MNTLINFSTVTNQDLQFFYQWIQSIVGRTLHRIGNNIVDTHLPGDDDDIKPPASFKHKFEGSSEGTPKSADPDEGWRDWIEIEPKDHGPSILGRFGGMDLGAETDVTNDPPIARTSGIDAAHSQGWSFNSV